jgi:hypothetical protein
MKVFRKTCGCVFRIARNIGSEPPTFEGEYIKKCAKFEEENVLRTKYLGGEDVTRFTCETQQLENRIERGHIEVDVIETVKEIEKSDGNGKA